MTRCAATSKRTGEPCGAFAMVGRTVCYHHGGRTPIGPAAPTWRHGRRSKSLPGRLLAGYQESLADPDRLAMSAELAVLDARLDDVLGRVDTGESGRLWDALAETWEELTAARAAAARATPSSRDWQIAQAKFADALATIGGIIDRGRGDWSAWEDVRTLIRDRQRLVESERKRMIEAQQYIAFDQAMTLVATIVDTVKRHADAPTLRAVTAELARLTGRPDPTTVLAESADRAAE
jgi:hypothetical protein